MPLATVDVTWTATWTQDAPVAGTQWWVRHGAERQYVFRFMRTPLTGFGLLPSLAWPFGVDRSVLYVPQSASAAIAGATSLEVEEHRGTVHTELPLRVDFVGAHDRDGRMGSRPAGTAGPTRTKPGPTHGTGGRA